MGRRRATLTGLAITGLLCAGFVDAHMHYRLVDVSSLKELTKRWYPRAYFNTPEKTGNHRALADIRESIAELRYYRDAVMVPPPGPDTSTAKELGNNHVVDHG